MRTASYDEKERKVADKEARKPRKLYDSDLELASIIVANGVNPTATAHRFGINEEDAVKLAKEITETVKNNWEKLAVKYGISRGKIEDMRPAFSACYE